MVTGILRGREHVIDTLLEGLFARHATLLYGPVGVGKTAVLHAVAERLRSQRHPCALTARTASRTDVKAALAATSPESGRAPALLLDGLVSATAPMRTLLHRLQGRGTGIVIAADVANERDHQRVRKMRLAYREVELPRLDRRIIRELLAGIVRPELIDDLVQIAHGLPGRAHLAAALAKEPRYWSKGVLMRSVLDTDVDTEMARRAMVTPE
jgi:DNA polymerase III delta prime subunit